MAVISGQVTFGSTGTKPVYMVNVINDLDTLGPNGSRGHADATNQFAYNNSGKDATHAISIYNSSGVKVVEASVTGGWGTSTLTFNCTLASASYPFDLIGRT